MIIGIPKEIKLLEHRVAMTPAGVRELVQNGHQVYVQSQAGAGSGFDDEAYLEQGAVMLQSAKELYALAEMIVKVKEPLPSEYELIRPEQIVFTYFHCAASQSLTEAMVQTKAVCIAYETVEKADRSLPLLTPMSEVAGRMAIQQGAHFLEKTQGGRGVLLGGVPGVKPASVLILGAGVVGTNAAKMAAGLGAQVTIMDVNMQRLRQLSDLLPANVTTIISNSHNILEALKQADLVIGAVLIPGGKAPILVSKDMLKLMKKGSVVIDVAVDQGGCIETCKPTTHAQPTFEVEGIIHYCVANMPGAVPYTSTLALTAATLPYVVQIANKGWRTACRDLKELALGLNIVEGNIVYQPIADTFGMEYKTLVL